MNWFESLFFGSGVPHSIFILTISIACGIYLSHRLKFKGITLGITWILFCAITMSHFGMHLDPIVETFAKDFGLILFVYSIGLQVGPRFFSSFGRGGHQTQYLSHERRGPQLSYRIHHPFGFWRRYCHDDRCTVWRSNEHPRFGCCRASFCRYHRYNQLRYS